MEIIGIIPARYGSTRYEGKPLISIGGKTMIQRTYEQAKKATALSDVIIATDDERIVAEIERFGGKYCITGSHHPSGTDRCAEVIEKIGFKGQAVVNIQGDEPFIDPRQINDLCLLFEDEAAGIVTQVKYFYELGEILSPNTAKVARDVNGYALYFSRSVIPYLRGKETADWLLNFPYTQHVGIYGYRTEVLNAITKLQPSALEIAESLEQLRWLENGFKIKTGTTEYNSLAIDTPSDLQKAEAFLLKTSVL